MIRSHAEFPDELQEGAERTNQQVREHLTASGKSISTLSIYQFRAHAQQAAKTATDSTAAEAPSEEGEAKENTEDADYEATEPRELAPGEVDPYARALSARLSDEFEFDAIVFPDLLIRSAKLMKSGNAKWDGVRRKQQGGGTLGGVR